MKVGYRFTSMKKTIYLINVRHDLFTELESCPTEDFLKSTGLGKERCKTMEVTEVEGGLTAEIFKHCEGVKQKLGATITAPTISALKEAVTNYLGRKPMIPTLWKQGPLNRLKGRVENQEKAGD